MLIVASFVNCLLYKRKSFKRASTYMEGNCRRKHIKLMMLWRIAHVAITMVQGNCKGSLPSAPETPLLRSCRQLTDHQIADSAQKRSCDEACYLYV